MKKPKISPMLLEKLTELLGLFPYYQLVGIPKLTSVDQGLELLKEAIEDNVNSYKQTMEEVCDDPTMDDRKHCTCISNLREGIKLLQAENTMLKANQELMKGYFRPWVEETEEEQASYDNLFKEI